MYLRNRTLPIANVDNLIHEVYFRGHMYRAPTGKPTFSFRLSTPHKRALDNLALAVSDTGERLGYAKHVDAMTPFVDFTRRRGPNRAATFEGLVRLTESLPFAEAIPPYPSAMGCYGLPSKHPVVMFPSSECVKRFEYILWAVSSHLQEDVKSVALARHMIESSYVRFLQGVVGLDRLQVPELDAFLEARRYVMVARV